MKHLLYIFLVLAALFAAIYLLPERSPLFEYYRLRPIFEISSILLLIVVLYLYRREKRQVKMIFSRLSQKNFFLDLAYSVEAYTSGNSRMRSSFSSILSVTSRRESSWRRCGN